VSDPAFTNRSRTFPPAAAVTVGRSPGGRPFTRYSGYATSPASPPSAADVLPPIPDPPMPMPMPMPEPMPMPLLRVSS